MTTVSLPNSSLDAGFLQGENWGAKFNRNLRVIDALLQCRVIDKDLTAPPGSPAGGDVYIVGAAATGAWSGQDGDLAIWMVGDDLTSAWTFVSPKAGWRVYLIDEALDYTFTTAWAPVPAPVFPDMTWNPQTASYTAAIGDKNNAVEMNVATANTFTLPLNSSVAFPIGTSILVYQEGVGLTTIAASSGVTLKSRSVSLALSGQYAVARVIKRATDTWVLTGDVAP